MHKKLLLQLFLLLTLLPISACADGPRPMAMLMSDSQAVRRAVSDAYIYSLAEHFDRIRYIDNDKHAPAVAVPLCSPVASRKITNESLRLECKVMRNNVFADCQDLNGCIDLKVHPEILSDPEMNKILVQTIRSPCKHIPQTDRFHWGGFSYANYISVGILNCGKHKLPYSEAFVSYGDKRVKIDMK